MREGREAEINPGRKPGRVLLQVCLDAWLRVSTPARCRFAEAGLQHSHSPGHLWPSVVAACRPSLGACS